MQRFTFHGSYGNLFSNDFPNSQDNVGDHSNGAIIGQPTTSQVKEEHNPVLANTKRNEVQPIDHNAPRRLKR